MLTSGRNYDCKKRQALLPVWLSKLLTQYLVLFSSWLLLLFGPNRFDHLFELRYCREYFGLIRPSYID